MKTELAERLFCFNVRTIKLLRSIKNDTAFQVINYQLTKSASSAASNYEEAQAGSSRADFKNKVNISLKEMRESNYWLRLIDAIQFEHKNEIQKEVRSLIKESLELKNILGSIMVKLYKS